MSACNVICEFVNRNGWRLPFVYNVSLYILSEDKGSGLDFNLNIDPKRVVVKITDVIVKEDKLKEFLSEFCNLINNNKLGKPFYYLVDIAKNIEIFYFDDSHIQVINKSSNTQNNYTIDLILQSELDSVMKNIGLENINSAQWKRIPINK